jgi:Concanavalin A-like lectin/glucanases superfamily
MKPIYILIMFCLVGCQRNPFPKTSPCVAAPTGLVSWWRAEGNANDIIGTNNGMTMGSLNYTNGKVGLAFSLDGARGYVLTTNSPSLNPPGGFTIEGWIYPTQDADQKILSKWGDQGIYENNRSYALKTTPGLGLALTISDLANQWNSSFQEFTVTGVLTLKAWNHVAGTYDSGTGIRRLFVNGVNVGSHTNTPVAVYDSIGPVTIGTFLRSPDYNQNYFQGLIDEPSLYNRALSPTEIVAIYNAGSDGKCRN